jgi:dihydrodipicolinate synthase/N-acetylneuraminate lyase
VARRWLIERHHQTHILPIAEIKAWSELLGMAAGPVRTPLLQLTAEERARMRDDLESIGLLPPAISAAVA